MIVPTLLVFVLSWGTTAAFMALASLGQAPTWLLLTAPMLVAAIPAYGLLSVGSERPVGERSQRVARISEFVEGAVALGISFVLTGFLIVVAMPLEGSVQDLAAGVAAIVGCLLAGRISWVWSTPDLLPDLLPDLSESPSTRV